MNASPADAPLALVGLPRAAAQALRELGLVAVAVPATPLAAVLDACATLGCTGALLAEPQTAEAYPLVRPDSAARKQARVDALSFGAERHGTHSFEDALLRVVEASGYAAQGGRMLVLGSGEPLTAALGLARLGFSEVMVAAPSLPDAEAALALLPAGTQGRAVHVQDEALAALSERADLIVLASGELPRGLLHPFHALLDLTGRAAGPASAAQVSTIPVDSLPRERLALALEHATGQRFHAAALGEVAALVAG